MVNKKCGAAISTHDTIVNSTFNAECHNKHVHLASTPLKPQDILGTSNIDVNVTPDVPPKGIKDETAAESILQNAMRCETPHRLQCIWTLCI